MFGLAPFASAPFSSVLNYSASSDLVGLQANALLNSVIGEYQVPVAVTGLQANAVLMTGSTVMKPVYWTLVDTTQDQL
jgi:hypothetical protein